MAAPFPLEENIDELPSPDFIILVWWKPPTGFSKLWEWEYFGDHAVSQFRRWFVQWLCCKRERCSSPSPRICKQ